MRTLGHGKAEKEAACGALQWRRGEAPNAALRLSPTFVADKGQRMKPHAASATINARARPHATSRRMLSNSPFEPRRATRCADSYSEPASKATKQGNKALKDQCRRWALRTRTERWGSRRRSADPYAGSGREAIGLLARLGDRTSGIREVRALRPKSGGGQAGARGNTRPAN